MDKDLSTQDKLRESISDDSLSSNEDEVNQMVEMAAEQLANLIWDHWLYIQRQKKKRSNTPET